MKSKISDYIKDSQKKILVQGKVPAYIVQDARATMIRLKMVGKKANWNTVIEACLVRFCIENKER